jgi:hypothetical protein
VAADGYEVGAGRGGRAPYPAEEDPHSSRRYGLGAATARVAATGASVGVPPPAPREAGTLAPS